MVSQGREVGPERCAYLQHAVQAGAAALHEGYAGLSLAHAAWLQQLNQQSLRQVLMQGALTMATVGSRS